MGITKTEFKNLLRSGEFTSIGGYPQFFLTEDDTPISWAGAKEERDEIMSAIDEKKRGDDYDESRCVVSYHVNWEDNSLTCDVTGEDIEIAYEKDDDD